MIDDLIGGLKFSWIRIRTVIAFEHLEFLRLSRWKFYELFSQPGLCMWSDLNAKHKNKTLMTWRWHRLYKVLRWFTLIGDFVVLDWISFDFWSKLLDFFFGEVGRFGFSFTAVVCFSAFDFLDAADAALVPLLALRTWSVFDEILEYPSGRICLGLSPALFTIRLPLVGSNAKKTNGGKNGEI